MHIKIFDGNGESFSLSEKDSQTVIRGINSDLDPRVSSCINCNSAVVAAEPFTRLIESFDAYEFDNDVMSNFVEFLDNADTVHLYVWEENDCAHALWLDPLFSEWSSATGEKRIRHQA